MYKTVFARELFGMVPDTANENPKNALEAWLTKWWGAKSYNVARPTGLFKHERLDREFGNIRVDSKNYA